MSEDPLVSLRDLAATVSNEDFPFEEIRTESGDYFASIEEASAAGYPSDQVWSVTEENNEWFYGPPHHWINLVGYIATKEKHDHKTYYIETVSDDYDEPTEAEEWHSFDPDC